MLAGFAIKDSVSALIQKQFVQIIKYDATISYSDESVLDTVKADDRIDDYDTIHTYLSDVGNAEVIEDEDKQQKEDITIDVVENANEFEKFILLRKRNTNVTYKLDNDGVCITEQLAGTLGVRAGDTIYLSSDSGIRKPAVVSHVVEMYTNSYIFMTAGYYEKVFGEEYLPNAILVTLTQKNDDLQNEVGSDYLSMDNVKGITFCSSNIEKFNNMISSINLVTYVLILSAAALTFVVLYNLINVNVSERIREIATIKVLGFFDKEVAAYVYRENIVISIIGSLAGLILGRGLHLYIMKTIEMDNVMFGDAVRPVSYVYSFVLTMIFALFVNLVMYNRLRKVPMVESLKSVE
jgi:putative ABC transport system permease protein